MTCDKIYMLLLPRPQLNLAICAFGCGTAYNQMMRLAARIRWGSGSNALQQGDSNLRRPSVAMEASY
jgi:hypothetical protein